MTAPLTKSECGEVHVALWACTGLSWWDATDWCDIHTAVHRLAEMGMVWQFNAHLANAPGADGGCYVAAPIATWGRAILDTVRAAQAQEK